MKFSVDRIEEGIAVLENINSKEMIEVEISELDFVIFEGNILVYENGIFSLDKSDEELRREVLRERLNNLKKSENNE